MYDFKTRLQDGVRRQGGQKSADGYVRLLADMIAGAIKDTTHDDLQKRMSARRYIFRDQGRDGWRLQDAVSRINGRIREVTGVPGGLSVGQVQRLARERIRMKGQDVPE